MVSIQITLITLPDEISTYKLKTGQNKFEKNGKTEIAVYPLEKFFKK